MKKTTYTFDQVMEKLDEVQTDIEISYEIRYNRPDVCAFYKKLIKDSIDSILRLDWTCNTDEEIKITDKIISLQGQLQLY